MSRKMSSGYAYEFNGKRNWRASSEERWEIVCETPDGCETEVGVRTIDGAACVAFKCTDGKYRAQIRQNVTPAELTSRARALALGWAFRWEDDSEAYQMGDAETEHPTEVLGCMLVDANGDTLASLWGIGDPSNEYARQVEDELAGEALENRAAAAAADLAAHTFQAL